MDDKQVQFSAEEREQFCEDWNKVTAHLAGRSPENVINNIEIELDTAITSLRKICDNFDQCEDCVLYMGLNAGACVKSQLTAILFERSRTNDV